MKILVTGGGGFLGQHIIDKLLDKGHQITNLSRGDYPELIEKGVRCIRGSINDPNILVKAVADQEAVFHVASKVAMWGKYEDFYDTNVEGTKSLLRAAKEEGIKKFIYTSTPSVVFGEESIENGDEQLPYPALSFSRYAKTKAIAEKEVILANSDQFKTVSLRPHLIFGPGDQNLIPRLVASAKKNKLKIVGEGNNLVDVLYVENAADAHICALEALERDNEKVSGKSYFIGQGPVKLWPFINEILAQHSLAPIKKKISFKKAFFIGTVIESLLRIFKIHNIHPPMTRFVALQLAKSHYFSHKNAQNDLGWYPKVSIKEALSNLIVE